MSHHIAFSPSIAANPDVVRQRLGKLPSTANGRWQVDFLERPGRTVVKVKFYGEGDPARALLDQLTREAARQLVALVDEFGSGLVQDPPKPGEANIVRHKDLKWLPLSYPEDPEVLGEYAEVTGRIGSTQVVVHVSRISPGERSTRYHLETLEEEYFFVYSGRCVAEVEGKHHELSSGDFLVTLPGEAHMFSNPFDEPCEFVGFGGPDLTRNGSIYPYAKDLGWAARLEKVRVPAI